MDPVSAIFAFSFAAFLLTITPGLDSALVLRTAAVEGPRPAMLAGVGICFGSFIWGLATALGLSALLAVSETAFHALKIAGALYLFYLGYGMLRSALSGGRIPLPTEGAAPPRKLTGREWLLRGLTTNLLNPKVGAFYVSFLPQFIPAGVNVALFSLLLAGIHAAMSILWFGLLTLATRPLSRTLQKPSFARGLDGVLGVVLVGFGLRLLFDEKTG